MLVYPYCLSVNELLNHHYNNELYLEIYCCIIHQSLWKILAPLLHAVTWVFSFNLFTLIATTPTLPAVALQLRILMDSCWFRREWALTHCQTLEKNHRNPHRICLSQHFKIEELNYGSCSQQSSVGLGCLKATTPPKQLWKKALWLWQAKLTIMSPSPRVLLSSRAGCSRYLSLNSRWLARHC